MIEWANRSLRLCEVLEQEQAYVHGQKKNEDYDELQLIETFKLQNRDEFLGKLAKWLTPERRVDVPEKTYNPSELCCIKLAEWMLNRSPGAGTLSAVKQEKLINEILVRKLEADLINEEPWLQDAPLRPYTRGLIESYIYQRDNRIRSWLFTQGTSTNDRFDWSRIRARAFTSQQSTKKLLNRLLLEDGFSGAIVRMDDERLDNIFEEMRKKTQKALCLSGGGIRSGTFALGVAQGLAEIKQPSGQTLLEEFTYLSTVSGGGYLGGWLSAWIYHEGTHNVFRKLNPSGDIPFEPEATPVQHLRRYSNYLSPSLGLFSADTWTLIAIYLRNLLLIWLVIIPFLAALVAVPWFIMALTTVKWMNWPLLMTISGMAAVIMIISDRFVYAYHPKSEDGSPLPEKIQASKSWDQSKFLLYCLLPGSVAIFLWTLTWQWFLQVQYTDAPKWFTDFRSYFIYNESTGLTLSNPKQAISYILTGTLVFAIIELTVDAILKFLEKKGYVPSRYNAMYSGKVPKGWSMRLKELAAIVVTGLVTGPLLLLTATWIPVAENQGLNPPLYVSISFPAFMITMLFVGIIYTGLTSSITDDAEREWDARYNAWYLIVAVGWLVITGIVLFGPFLANKLVGLGWTATTGLLSGYLTALLGRNSKITGKGEGAGAKQTDNGSQGLLGLLSQITLPVVSLITLIALLIVLSYMDMALIRLVCEKICAPGTQLELTLEAIARVNPLAPALVLGGLFIFGLLSAWVIDTNRFSLHAMYRARLIRAYLGASRPPGERKPDPFTGFDESDNIHMGNLIPSSKEQEPGEKIEREPFHVINIALNLVAGRNLAWQERKAESFTVSPLHAGSLYLGYRHTYLSGSQQRPVPKKDGGYYGGDRGITLGTAMTVSGAAVSPNSGYHSSPLVAFFMTLFNARLGWWLGNPGPAGDTTFHRSSPRLAIRPILNELIGNTDDTSDYVFLSDGGHFDNLGLYEMVLRRNRLILVSDASCDEECTLEDLGNAIRKIRIDLGIPIDFPGSFSIHARSVNPAKKDGSRYWAVGRIHYSEVDQKRDKKAETKLKYDGILLYIKPGFYGQEPRDIFNYASANKAFPHESTGDQFFSESQFESYRALGKYTIKKLREEFKQTYGISLKELFTEAGIERCLEKL